MLFKRKGKPAPQQSSEEKLRLRTETTAHQLYHNRLIFKRKVMKRATGSQHRKLCKVL